MHCLPVPAPIGALRRCCWTRRLLCLLLLSSLTGLVHAATPASLRVVYPQSESSGDARMAYPLAVLHLALERSGGDFRLEPSQARMQQSRSLRELANGGVLDVAWSVTSPERESGLRPVRFPIDRGLMGWRVLLVHKDALASFASIQDTAQLARRLGGQGHDWPDLAVLRDNGLPTAASPTYEGLFAMLARGHIDYFPRALSEVRVELDAHAQMPIALEPHLLLAYPSALYFFVHPDNAALAQAIERGLERSLQDGSFMRLFNDTYAGLIASLELPGRRLLRLRRTDLPAATPLARRELWFQPGESP